MATFKCFAGSRSGLLRMPSPCGRPGPRSCHLHAPTDMFCFLWPLSPLSLLIARCRAPCAHHPSFAGPWRLPIRSSHFASGWHRATLRCQCCRAAAWRCQHGDCQLESPRFRRHHQAAQRPDGSLRRSKILRTQHTQQLWLARRRLFRERCQGGSAEEL